MSLEKYELKWIPLAKEKKDQLSDDFAVYWKPGVDANTADRRSRSILRYVARKELRIIPILPANPTATTGGTPPPRSGLIGGRNGGTLRRGADAQAAARRRQEHRNKQIQIFEKTYQKLAQVTKNFVDAIGGFFLGLFRKSKTKEKDVLLTPEVITKAVEAEAKAMCMPEKILHKVVSFFR